MPQTNLTLVLHFQLRIVSDDGGGGSIPRCILCIIYRHLLKLSPALKCISSLVLGSTHTKLQPGSLLAAANLSLVDLCQVEERDVSRPDKPHLYGVVRREVRCPSLGLGLVRNIDTSRHLLHLATPTPPASLQAVNCLLLGEVQLPSSVLTARQERAPYVAQQSDNPLDCSWQRYHKPRGNI